MVSITDFQPYKYENLARRGSVHDGGYVIPSDLTANLLISFGLGYDWKFELDLIRCKQVDRFIVFDHTVNVSKLLKNLLLRKPNLNSYMYLSIVLFRYLRDFVFLQYLHIRKKISPVGELENKKLCTQNPILDFKEYLVRILEGLLRHAYGVGDPLRDSIILFIIFRK